MTLFPFGERVFAFRAKPSPGPQERQSFLGPTTRVSRVAASSEIHGQGGAQKSSGAEGASPKEKASLHVQTPLASQGNPRVRPGFPRDFPFFQGERGFKVSSAKTGFVIQTVRDPELTTGAQLSVNSFRFPEENSKTKRSSKLWSSVNCGGYRGCKRIFHVRE